MHAKVPAFHMGQLNSELGPQRWFPWRTCVCLCGMGSLRLGPPTAGGGVARGRRRPTVFEHIPCLAGERQLHAPDELRKHDIPGALSYGALIDRTVTLCKLSSHHMV